MQPGHYSFASMVAVSLGTGSLGSERVWKRVHGHVCACPGSLCSVSTSVHVWAVPTRLLEPLALWFSGWHSDFLWSRSASFPGLPEHQHFGGGHGKGVGGKRLGSSLALLWILTSHWGPMCLVLSHLPPEGWTRSCPCVSQVEREREGRKDCLWSIALPVPHVSCNRSSAK